MKRAKMVRRTVVATTWALQVACLFFAACRSDPVGTRPDLEEPQLPPENRGRVVASGVSTFAIEELVNPQWAWLDDGHELTYLTSTGLVGEGALWHLDVDAGVATKILGLSVPANVAYAPDESRIYVGEWHGLYSVAPDGSDPLMLTDAIRGHVSVSPSGRYLGYTLDDSGADIIIDTQLGDTLQLLTTPRPWRLFDSGHLLFPMYDGLGVVEIAVGDTTVMSHADAPSPNIDIRGTADGPVVTGGTRDSESSSLRVRTFSADAAGPGEVTPLVTVTSGIWSGSWVTGALSLDGDLLALGLVRRISCSLDGCIYTYDIVVYDLPSGTSRIVANGSAEWRPEGVTFSPDGKRLLYGTERNLYLVELTP